MNVKYAIVLHLFYLDLWPEIAEHLCKLPQPFDLFVTATHEEYDSAKNIVQPLFPCARLFPVENRGRDVAPFLHVAQQVDLHQYDCVCKIHTKKSLHLESGDQWRIDMLTKLFQSVPAILQQFMDNPALGMIAPADHVLFYNHLSSGNTEQVSSLLQKMQIFANFDDAIFIAGSMFWFKPIAINKLFNLKLASVDFEKEEKQIDGTLAHAIERLFCIAASEQGYLIADTNILFSNGTSRSQDIKAIAKEVHSYSTGIPCHWDFTVYENGVPAEAQHKEIYLSRPDLRYHYPDAAKVNCRHSFFWWLASQGCNEYPELAIKLIRFGNKAIFNESYLNIYYHRPDLQSIFPNPLSVEKTECYYHWLITQGILEYPELKRETLIRDAQFQNGAQFTLPMCEIYLGRPDLQAAYPNPYAIQEDQHSFYDWIVNQYALINDNNVSQSDFCKDIN